MAGTVNFVGFKYKDTRPRYRFAISQTAGGTYTAKARAGTQITTDWTDVSTVYYKVYNAGAEVATEQVSAAAGSYLTSPEAGPVL